MPPDVPKGTKVAAGFDGSDVDDWTALRLETLTGYQFTPLFEGKPTIWNPAETRGQVDRGEVVAALEWTFETFDVVRGYFDPPYWQSEIDALEAKHEKRVVRFQTNQIARMHAALERFRTDVYAPDSTFTHDGCPITATHIRNAVQRNRPGQKYILGKASDTQKIDSCMASVLAHEAAMDAIAAGLNVIETPQYAYVM